MHYLSGPTGIAFGWFRLQATKRLSLATAVAASLRERRNESAGRRPLERRQTKKRVAERRVPGREHHEHSCKQGPQRAQCDEAAQPRQEAADQDVFCWPHQEVAE